MPLAPDSNSERPQSLEELAQAMPIAQALREILDAHRDAVLLLRAKRVPYPRIRQFLATQSVTLSVATLVRYCQDHADEIKRIRAQLLNTTKSAAPAASPSPRIPIASPPPKPAQPDSDSPPAITSQTTSERPVTSPLLNSLQRKPRDMRGPV